MRACVCVPPWPSCPNLPKGWPVCGNISLPFKFLAGLLLPGLGAVLGVNAWLDRGLLLQQLQKALILLTLPILGRQVVPASQKLQINSMLEKHIWPANCSEQVG